MLRLRFDAVMATPSVTKSEEERVTPVTVAALALRGMPPAPPPPLPRKPPMPPFGAAVDRPDDEDFELFRVVPGAPGGRLLVRSFRPEEPSVFFSSDIAPGPAPPMDGLLETLTFA